MCIRDRPGAERHGDDNRRGSGGQWCVDRLQPGERGACGCCLLYTSDAADERSSVDLGGRRIIKKKNMKRVSGR